MAEWTSSADVTGPASVYNPTGDTDPALRSPARLRAANRKARVTMIVLFALALQVGLAAAAARYVPNLFGPTTSASAR